MAVCKFMLFFSTAFLKASTLSFFKINTKSFSISGERGCACRLAKKAAQSSSKKEIFCIIRDFVIIENIAVFCERDSSGTTEPTQRGGEGDGADSPTRAGETREAARPQKKIIYLGENIIWHFRCIWSRDR
jgi:hypothetical protein